MTVTLHKRDGTIITLGQKKPEPRVPPRTFVLYGKRVTLSEAAHILDVGLATVLRHTTNGVVDAAAIKARTFVALPVKVAEMSAQPPKPMQRGPSHWYEDRRRGGRPPISVRNRRIIRRIVSAFREARTA